MNAPQEFEAQSNSSSLNAHVNAQPPQLNLARSEYDRPLFVDMEKFFEFSFWISEELLDLEARFKPKVHARQRIVTF